MAAGTKTSELRRFRRAVVLQGSGLVVPHIATDCITALQQIGIASFGLETRWFAGTAPDSVCAQIRDSLEELKPDFILAMDCGVVRECPGFFADLGIPVAAWFVDDPTIDLTPEKIFDCLYVFTWDRAFIGPLRAMGCRVVEYLPLGANPNRFRRTPPEDPRRGPFLCDVSFVGSSLAKQSIKNEIEKKFDPRLREIANECILRHAAPPHPPVPELLGEIMGRMQLSLVAEDPRAFTGQIELEAMLLYRSRALNRLARFSPRVYGDDGWPSLLEPGPVFCGPIDYMGDLQLLYGASRINLNLTKSQLKTAVNQRVFDAPACGGFVLTDYREDVERLFDPDKELAVFRDYDEMEAKAAYFLENVEERESRARMTRRRVLAEHTYAHRMRRMLGVLAEYI